MKYYILTLIVCIGGCSSNYVKGPVMTKDKELIDKYPSEINRDYIDSNRRVTFKAIVEHVQESSPDEDDKWEFRLYLPNEPRYGGMKWQDYPTNLIRKLYRKSHNRSLWVIVNANVTNFSANYQIDPEDDPYYVINNSKIIAYYYTKKHSFKKNIPLPTK